jgi:competence protein ComEC
MYLFAFVLGILAQKIFFPSLFLLFFFSFDYKKTLIIWLSWACGFSWMWCHQKQSLPPIQDTGHHYIGRIQSFPNGGKVRVTLESLDHQKHTAQIWLDISATSKKLLPGEVWQWNGYHWHNHQEFWYRDDYRHIDGHSRLLPNTLMRCQTVSRWDILHRLQIACFNKAQQIFTNSYSRSLFLTLILGLGSELDKGDWAIFKLTGTAHLMVVSGAHLALLMMLVSGIIGVVWKVIYPLNLVIPRQKATCFFALLLGMFYALISGFSLPVKRAWLMMALRSFHVFYPKRISAWQSFRWSLMLLMLQEPHVLFYPATYLSFFAVLIIMYGNQWSIHPKYLKTFFLQVLCIVGMAPLTILWFENIPVIGIIANFFAIPWVSWLLLPMGLLLAFDNINCFNQLFNWAAFALQKTLTYMSAYHDLNIAWHWPSNTVAVLILCIIGLICWLPSLPLVAQGLLACFLICYPVHMPINHQQFIVQVLDVGQGLSVLVSTKSHHLLFDTATNLATKKVVLPFLKHHTISHLDTIVLSHHDADHCGGLAELRKKYLSSQLISSYGLGKNCHLLPSWQWDGVMFEFLGIALKNSSKNNQSCVLKISTPQQSILLTGDIERQAEYQLIYQHQKKLRASVLLVPHHGSLTSSSLWFLDMVKPKLAVLSVALKNRYHLPHPEVLKRYEKMAIPYMSTAHDKMISLYFLGQSFRTKPFWWQWLE